MARILVIDDDVDILSAAKLLLKRHYDEVTLEKNPDKIPFLLNNYEFDLILLDMNFTQDVNSGREGFLWLDKILDIKPKAKVVLFTAYGDVEMAVKSMKLGAKDFVLKPWDNEKLLETLNTALGKEADEGSVSKSSQTNIIGSSEAMQKVFDTIQKVAETDANVLVLGENGTGKDLVARQLHEFSKRKENHFVRVDIAALPETLVESELFGHVKGAFTDARENRVGKFEDAKGGTLFLDEIGNLNATVQSKLLNVLQNREVTRIGSNKTTKVDIRLISATNANIELSVQEKEFRQDLYYRINTITIELPPLRERYGDIELLAEFFLNKYKKKYNRQLGGLSAALVKELNHYPWPGNIRELEHAIERAVIMSSGRQLTAEDVFGSMSKSSIQAAEKELKSFDLEELERDTIVKALKKFNGNISETAKELGLSRAALYRRMEKYNI
ncbi:DNA-binding transcriptional response regulator, NtrC family, contains REC, AAA-type ATPase, and a Fis-type DNA-binding domains [Spirosomataceae bacterium TFI 002]|nr:DNA-binding transcriptional response regulator, NtrC family, contains REC, AAA-type ATPase, and a Fis-type DNA-binding domains [Spirosomataceae bacterium TFI 002]